MVLRGFTFIALFFWCTTLVDAQYKADTKNGLVFTAEDSSFSFRINPVLQNQILYNSTTPSNEPELLFLNRRIRFYFYGYIFDPKLSYKIQLRLEKNDQNIYDVAFKYKASERLTFWIGMETVPAARSQLVSLKYLQFVDRSIVHSIYDLQKDIGIWAFYNFDIAQSHIKTAVNISNGEGIFRPVDSRGLSYTGRLDILPFGKFAGNGDIRGVDLEREPTPKLAFGVAYNFNENATASRGQRGTAFENGLAIDISNLYVDTIFKYRGYSLMAERINRNTENPTIASNTTVFNGTGFSVQMGYLLLSNIDVSVRYAGLHPDKEIELLVPGQDDYTVGVSKFFRNHHFKIQTDLTYRKFNGIITGDLFQLRTQISMNF